MKFDAALIPAQNNGQLGKIKLKLLNNNYDMSLSFDKWIRQFVSQIRTEALNLQKRMGYDYLTDEDFMKLGLLAEQEIKDGNNDKQKIYKFLNETNVNDDHFEENKQKLVEGLAKKAFFEKLDQNGIARWAICNLVIDRYKGPLTNIIHFLDPVEVNIKGERYFSINIEWCEKDSEEWKTCFRTALVKTVKRFFPIDRGATVKEKIIKSYCNYKISLDGSDDSNKFKKAVEKNLSDWPELHGAVRGNSEYQDAEIKVLQECLNKKFIEYSYIYSIEPKERVQNISEVAARDKMNQILLSLKASAGKKISADSITKFTERSEQKLQGIQRRPLAVGFINGKREFGWILGPKFKISSGNTVSFEHTPTQYSFRVNIVVPSWWHTAGFEGEYCWLTNSGKPVTGYTGLWPKAEISSKAASDTDSQGTRIGLPLPGDPLTATKLFMVREDRPKPFISAQCYPKNSAGKIPVTIGKTASILIRGMNLWRNPQVFIGSQLADSTRILPDMKGLVATFTKVQEVWFDAEEQAKVHNSGKSVDPVCNNANSRTTGVITDLVIVTSNGMSVLKNAVEYYCSPAAKETPGQEPNGDESKPEEHSAPVKPPVPEGD